MMMMMINFEHKMSKRITSLYAIFYDVISCCVWSCDMGKM